MAITKQIIYSGTVDALPMFRKFSIEKEFTEVYDAQANTRVQEATGGMIVTATFDVLGEEVTVSATVPQAQLGSMTLSALLTAAAAKLKTKLEV